MRRWLFAHLISVLLIVCTSTSRYPDRFASLKQRSLLSENQGSQSRIRPLSLIIFTAPLPFVSLEDSIQRLSLSSWLQIDPSVIVYLIGSHPTFFLVAEEVNRALSSTGDSARVRVIEAVDCNYKGVPLFNSILKTAMAMGSEHLGSYSMIVTPHTIILKNVLNAISLLVEKHDGFVMTAAERSLLYPTLEPAAPFFTAIENSPLLELNEESISRFADENVKSRLTHKSSFWLWNNSPLPLLNGSLLPFSFQRGGHDRWLANEIVADGRLALVDVSNAVTTFHFRRMPWYLIGHRVKNNDVIPRPHRWSTLEKDEEDFAINHLLLEEHRSKTENRSLQSLAPPLQLKRCSGGKNNELCESAVACKGIGNSNSADDQRSHSSAEDRWICSMCLPVKPLKLPELGSNLSSAETEAALSAAADSNKTVVLVAVSGAYKDMLMSFTCNLRRLGISNMVVGALDPEIYDFAKKQGLPVFFDLSAKKAAAEKVGSRTNDGWGTAIFKKLSKSKSKVVLNVLKLGYNVLFSDVDIVWFRDPFPEILAYPEDAFLAQSDQPKMIDPANGGNNSHYHVAGSINSGFYFARSQPKIIGAFERIVEHARMSNLTEQPSFYKVFCGNGGQRYLVGNDQCLLPEENLRTIFFPRMLHPNGFYNDFWLANDTQAACAASGCATLHNNWIYGKDLKMARAKKKGFWYFDNRSRACKYD